MPVGTEIYKRDLDALKAKLREQGIGQLVIMMRQTVRFGKQNSEELHELATRAWDGELDLEKAP